MAFDEDRRAAAIAAEWGINVELLEETHWTLETIDSNEGDLRGYFVRFREDTDRKVLNQLGAKPGEFYRELSMNAFDEPDHDDESDDGIYSIDQPLPDISDFVEDDFEIQEPPERSKDGRRAYYIGEERFTPSQFKRLSRRRKVEAMVEWFHENYEDPAVRLPYESAEGGYQWIWGGPYSADEEIGNEFSDIADLEVIEEAVADVTGDGLFDWAPKARRDDYASDEDFDDPREEEDYNQSGVREDYTKTVLTRRDNPPHHGPFLTDGNGNYLTDSAGNRLIVSAQQPDPTVFGFAEGLGATFGHGTFGNDSSANQEADSPNFQRELLSRLEILEAALETYRSNLPPRNHNHPPELVEPDPITPSEVRIVVELAVELRAEAQRDQPDPAKLEAQASTLRKVAGSILAWFGRKADSAIDSAIKWAVPAIGGAWTLAHPEAVHAALMAVAGTASAWAAHLQCLW